MAADIVLFRGDDLAHAGALDPLQALPLCAPVTAETVLIGGKIRVRHGQIEGVNLPVEIAKHRTIARGLWQKAWLMR
jgi:8-oxoguanine deaminase